MIRTPAEGALHLNPSLQTSPRLPPSHRSLPQQPLHQQNPLLPRDRLFFRPNNLLLCPQGLHPSRQSRRDHLEHHDQGRVTDHRPNQCHKNYSLMVHSGVVPNHHTHTFAITACARSQALELGRSFHAEVVKVGLQSDVFVLNSLIRMYADSGGLGDGHELFVGSAVRDVVSWNVMIGGFARGGFYERAFDMFEEMLGAGGVVPDEVTMISLVSACTQLSDIGKGRLLRTYIKDVGLDADNVHLANAVLDMYCTCGDVASAWIAFNEMRDINVLTYTIMISGLTGSGCFQESLDLFWKM